MSSSGSDPSSGIPQGLKDLFSWNPPLLNPLPLPGQKMSTKTRPPAFFDKHFSTELQLHCVKRLPSLAHDIAAIVDETITNSFHDGVRLPPSGTLPSAEHLESIVSNIDWFMADEKAVASFYDKTTATFCAPVASTLALRLPDWKHSLLVWSQSSNVSGYAIADGFLKVTSPKNLDNKEMQLKEAMDEEMLTLLRALSTRSASLVTNKFKNVAGGPEIMLAIPNLSNSPSFDWTSCNSPECASLSSHERERKRVNTVIVGSDAENTPWTFNSRSDNPMFPSDPETVPPQPPMLAQPGGASVQGSSEELGTSKAIKRKRDKSKANSPVASEASSIPLATTFQDPEVRKSGRLAAKKQKPNDPINDTQSTSLMLPLPLPVGGVQVKTAGEGKGKGKTVVKGNVQSEGNDEDSDDEGDDEATGDPSYKDGHDLSAQFIIQQAWAQATRVDGSIIVLQSGNHEFIGIRHRTTRTLYISDLIKPYACKEPSYGKLHVGVYIAGIKDALNRERQRRDTQPPGGGNGPSGGGNGPSGSGNDKQDGPSGGGPGSGYRGDHSCRKGGRKDESRGGKKSKEGDYRGGNTHKKMVAAHKMAAKSTLKLASGRNVILLYLQYGIYDSSSPSTFVRSGPTGHPAPLPSQETIQNYRLEECLTIVLKSEIGHGATGQVLRGTLEVEMSECALLDVAVKLGLARGQCETLRDEYKIYHQLRSKGVTAGITTPLGLFDDVEGGACILVMPYVGAPLAATPELVLPISYREAVLAALAEIHHANILHGDLRLDNILVADSGLTIIDFSHSRACVDQDAKHSEYLQFRSLLDRKVGWT